jgi:ABC-2 type transport system permease protein
VSAATAAPRGAPPLRVQIKELARRSIVRTVRQPAMIVPATLFPLILLAINSAGLDSATSIPGFPTDSYLTFALAFAFLQAGVFALIGTGQNLAEDQVSGFWNRMQLTPIRAPALVAGQLAGTLALGLFQAATYITVGLTAGGHIQAGIPGALVLIALATLITLAFGSIGLIAGLRASSPENDWFRTIATYNPVSYMIEGIRSLLIFGWDAEALALGFGCAIAILAVALTIASLSLKGRMVRT